MSYVADSLIRSILVGSLYSLMALGLTLTYAASRFPNFAHGELITVGAYVSAVLTRFFDLGTSTLIAALASTLVAIVMYRLVCSPLMKRVSRILILMVATFALGLVVRNVVAVLASYYHLMNMRSLVTVVRFDFFGGLISNLFIWTLPITWAIVVGLHLFLNKTRLGKMMRASTDNPDLAVVCGIDTEKTTTMSWAVSGALAGIAGSLWSIYSFAFPEVGFSLLLVFFAASVVGGLTSFFGTIVGGYVIGFSENFLMDTLNINFGVDVAFKPLIAFVIIVAVLVIRPKGLADLSLPRFVKK